MTSFTWQYWHTLLEHYDCDELEKMVRLSLGDEVELALLLRSSFENDFRNFRDRFIRNLTLLTLRWVNWRTLAERLLLMHARQAENAARKQRNGR
jgi:hypothetical protein